MSSPPANLDTSPAALVQGQPPPNDDDGSSTCSTPITAILTPGTPSPTTSAVGFQGTGDQVPVDDSPPGTPSPTISAVGSQGTGDQVPVDDSPPAHEESPPLGGPILETARMVHFQRASVNDLPIHSSEDDISSGQSKIQLQDRTVAGYRDDEFRADQYQRVFEKVLPFPDPGSPDLEKEQHGHKFSKSLKWAIEHPASFVSREYSLLHHDPSLFMVEVPLDCLPPPTACNDYGDIGVSVQLIRCDQQTRALRTVKNNSDVLEISPKEPIKGEKSNVHFKINNSLYFPFMASIWKENGSYIIRVIISRLVVRATGERLRHPQALGVIDSKLCIDVHLRGHNGLGQDSMPHGDLSFARALHRLKKRRRATRLPRPRCRVCRRFGHFDSQCWVAHPEKLPKGKEGLFEKQKTENHVWGRIENPDENLEPLLGW